MTTEPRTRAQLCGGIGILGGGTLGYLTQTGPAGIVVGVIGITLLVIPAAMLIAPPHGNPFGSRKGNLLFAIRSVFILDGIFVVGAAILTETIKANDALNVVTIGLGGAMGVLTLLAFIRIGQASSGKFG